jgi:hypothetical protein
MDRGALLRRGWSPSPDINLDFLHGPFTGNLPHHYYDYPKYIRQIVQILINEGQVFHGRYTG